MTSGSAWATTSRETGRADVEAVEREAAVADARASARLARLPVERSSTASTAPALGEQAIDERRADEPRASGDERLLRHVRASRSARVRRAPQILSWCYSAGGTRPPGDPGAGRDADAGADQGQVGQRDLGLEDRVAPDHGIGDDRRAPRPGRPSRTTERSTRAPAPITTPGPTTDAVTVAPASIRAPAPTSSGRREPGLRVDVGAVLGPDAPGAFGRPGRRLAAERAREHIGVRLQVLRGRSHVEPVAVVVEGVEAAPRLDHARERLPFDRHVDARRDALERPRARARRCRR